MRKFLIWSFGALLSLTLAAALGVGWLYWRYADELPDHRFLLSKAEEPEACGAAKDQPDFIPLQALPANVVKAYVAYEDIEFYTRPRFTALSFAAWLPRLDWRGSYNDWASPFTKYAMKILNCRKDPSTILPVYATKTLLLAYRIERDIPKEVILERFINYAPQDWRNTGPVALAQLYFHKRLDELTLAEAAFMANASPQRRGYYWYREHATKRRNFLLDRMAQAGFITPEQAEEAKREPLVVQDAPPRKQ